MPSRVAAPGAAIYDPRLYDNLVDVPAHYRTDPIRFEALATDPAHLGNPPTTKTRIEAITGLEAENLGIVARVITRGSVDIEFYDGNGIPFDVKAPPSPPPGVRWSFNAARTANAILNALRTIHANAATGASEPVRVLLNTTYLNGADHAALWAYLNARATLAELDLVHELNHRP